MNPTVLEKALRAEFNRQTSQLMNQSGANQDLASLFLPLDSKSSYEKYGWLGSVPQVRQWIGEKRAAKLKDYDFTIRNIPWEVTIEVDRRDFENDETGSHKVRVQDLATRMRKHPSKLASDLIINGTTNLAYDGTAFFANRSVNDNLLAGTGVTLALLDADLDTVQQTMMAFVDEAGEKQNIKPTVIVCPPALENKFLRLVMSKGDPTVSGGLDVFNPYSGKYTIISDARLSDTTDWYAFASNGLLKPFILQNRKNVEPVMDDSMVKRTRMYQFSGEWDGNGGYGLPSLAVKVVNS